MALGPLGRIVVQFVAVAGSSLGRAVVRAYKDAARQGAAAAGSTASRSAPLTLRPRMSVDEARKILGFPCGPNSQLPTREEVMARYNRLFQINAPSENFAGSPYLQKRVAVARTIMLEQCSAKAPEAGAGSKESSGGG
ncbi:mitochondria-associated granulocyte macrophage CSF signaling molecule, putative [Eimeria tenella]|uniref:Mitochondria-associated granulocyte macrophage CSF signaling molecule, putative n=1 Tax=Eimeria tenella TaxID=5802 RepID=U6KXZ9_EIMTE|nr:mitochondria-associated granulocyte macrophage CSF signaling molecule, putative [Eimeria tenella]CDJ43017.1 mitochondria-associated granulocyte macrophage CSF signaling molecule, putative [Eimeria tenella]|eukprot:XP_013233767.1 mitochondria-associated granulocyte macrophage CSF signaling molecule, putative [Eimeria tenella]